jgi:pyruvate kinase
MLPKVVEAGMRVMRINFSHATYEEADLRMKNLKTAKGTTQASGNLRAVMLDTQGPEIRTGSFGTDGKMDYLIGDVITLTTDPAMRINQTKESIFITYDKIMETVEPGSVVLLDDGAIELKVEKKDEAAGTVRCTVVNSGQLGSRKGVNLPGSKVQLPAMSAKDREDIAWGIKNDIDYIAVSFVRKADDLIQIREYVASLMRENGYPADYPHPLLISKIESTEAMDNFEEILHETDGVMVARGDLGVEIPMESLANAQKMITRRSNEEGKPVIVATQMLESMQKNPRPTRAECTDVANAIWDGADAVMLSGESAKGSYPVEAVSMMQRIIESAESEAGTENDVSNIPMPNYDDARDSIAVSCAGGSRALDASCIIVLSNSGHTAINIAKFRPAVPIVTLVKEAKLGRMLQMYRGVHPVVMTDSSTMLSMDPSRYDLAVAKAKELGFCSTGDKVMVVGAEAPTEITSTAHSMRVMSVK